MRGGRANYSKERQERGQGPVALREPKAVCVLRQQPDEGT